MDDVEKESLKLIGILLFEIPPIAHRRAVFDLSLFYLYFDGYITTIQLLVNSAKLSMVIYTSILMHILKNTIWLAIDIGKVQTCTII